MRAGLIVLALLVAAPAAAQPGPQASISCPAAAVPISPGSSIQAHVNAASAGSSFCIRAGIHAITSAITPKTGNTFTGEWGAILDGSTWTGVTLDHVAAFMAHLQDIDDVTIRNLVIRNMPQRCIHAYPQSSDRWTIEHNEITGCRSGVGLPNGAILRNNVIHHNNGDSSGGLIANGAYIAGWGVSDLLIEGNEIAYNGPIQKILGGQRVTFRNNFVHHNGNGIWFDGDNVDVAIEGNRVEDNGGEGIWYEVSGPAVIRNNVVRRNGVSGIFLSTSRDVEVYGNILESNWRGINLFWSCRTSNGYPGDIGHDLRNNSVHDNVITLGSQAWSMASALSVDGACTSAQAAPYLSNTKGNVFARNTYAAPDGSWYWNAWRTWAEWQALPQDLGGSIDGSPQPTPEPLPPVSDTSAPAVTALSVTPIGGSPRRKVHVEAKDNIGVTRIDVLLNGAVAASCPGSPCDKEVRIANSGIHLISARAVDAAGNVSPNAPSVQTWR